MAEELQLPAVVQQDTTQAIARVNDLSNEKLDTVLKKAQVQIVINLSEAHERFKENSAKKKKQKSRNVQQKKGFWCFRSKPDKESKYSSVQSSSSTSGPNTQSQNDDNSDHVSTSTPATSDPTSEGRPDDLGHLDTPIIETSHNASRHFLWMCTLCVILGGCASFIPIIGSRFF